LVVDVKADGRSDQYLLEQFVSVRDETAFTTLLRRHGSMVMSVCWRTLRDQHLAEDAFQAVFLVLALKARAIRERGSLASWLYGVARRLAGRLKVRAHRSVQFLIREHAQMVPNSLAEVSRREEEELLDEELQRLPDKYRLPLLLCYFEGL